MVCDIFFDLPNGKMPALGYGTWQSKDESLEVGLETALKTGYRHIDTAQWYDNEQVVGKVLRRWFNAGTLNREDVFVTTKVPPMVYPDKVEEALAESLRKLQLDYVDLYLIHFPVLIHYDDGESSAVDNLTYMDVWRELEREYDAGRAKHIGVSNFNRSHIERMLKNCQVKPHNLQIELHVYMQQRELVDYCKGEGITVVAYSPLGSPGYNAFMQSMGRETKEVPDLFEDAVVRRVSEKHSRTPAQVMLRYLLQIGVAPIPKSVTPSRIKENFDVFDFSLDDADMKALLDVEVGPSVRVCDMAGCGRSVLNHPDFPF